MRKTIVLLLLCFLTLTGCKKELENPICETITTVERYNEIVREGAETIFENYYFIDLRSNSEYKLGYISNFYPSNHIVYQGEESIDLIIEHINKTNTASYTCAIILLDSGLEEDETSTIVYNALVDKGYLNVKDVTLGYIGLKNEYKTGYPYSLRDGSDCGC